MHVREFGVGRRLDQAHELGGQFRLSNLPWRTVSGRGVSVPTPPPCQAPLTPLLLAGPSCHPAGQSAAHPLPLPALLSPLLSPRRPTPTPRPGPQLSTSQQLRVCVELSQQLAALHDAAVAHLDLKAQNVLVDGRHADGTPQLKVSASRGSVWDGPVSRCLVPRPLATCAHPTGLFSSGGGRIKVLTPAPSLPPC